jgi:hypothetical protein
VPVHSEAAARPDAAAEIRLVSLDTLPGINFWSKRPVTRIDVAVGAYDEISSADVPGFADRLVAALPGLWEHRCSIGEPGGFVTRLRRGTYAPHIMEHVALELQSMMGHEVGYGRARGGDRAGEYTVVFEHRHAAVGQRAAVLALSVVREAFAGTLGPVDRAVAELRTRAAAPDASPPRQEVRCGVTGGAGRAAAREAMLRRGAGPGALVVDVAPASLLRAGLPYARSDAAVILDAEPADVPERYRDPERARQLVSVVADGVGSGGVVVAPAGDPALHERVLDAGCRLAVFAADGRVGMQELRVAHAAAVPKDGRIELRCRGERLDLGALEPGAPPAPQLAAALAVHALQQPELSDAPTREPDGDAADD